MAASIKPIRRVITLMPVRPSTWAMRPEAEKTTYVTRPITTPYSTSTPNCHKKRVFSA